MLQQLGMVEMSRGTELGRGEAGAGSTEKTAAFNLDKLMAADPTEMDRKLGICPVPLYELPPEELELLQRGTDVDAVRDLLRRRHLLQFFFPAADHVVLGLVDRGIKTASQAVNELLTLPDLGHPFGPAEIAREVSSLTDIVDALQECGMVVQTDLAVELTPTGKSVRLAVSARPRESLISKLLNRISVNIDLKDLFRGPH
jgi:hypothetical protein